MGLIIFLKSATVNIRNFTIKDPLGSSGRLDVIVRCILATLLNEEKFEEDIQIWVFLENFGTFIFNTKILDIKTFPKTELMLLTNFVQLIKGDNLEDNILASVEKSEMNIIEALRHLLQLNFNVYILNETGKDFYKELSTIQEKENAVFIIGNQSGEFIDSKELLDLELPNLNLGNQSLLASSIIRLIKLALLS